MKEVYADAVFWIALLTPRDSLHHRALEVSKTVAWDWIVTSEMVLVEVLNSLSGRGMLARGAAVQVVEAFGNSGDTIVVSQTRKQFQAAVQRYKSSSDKEWSLTDCASFLIMEERGIRAALTHDKHFEQAGFEALLR